MYAILKADMSTYLYCKAFILTAGLKYDSRSDDIQKQITNLSLNKRIQGHPGQIPINMREAYPKVRTKSLLIDLDFPGAFCSFLFLFNKQGQKIFYRRFVSEMIMIINRMATIIVAVLSCNRAILVLFCLILIC